MALRPRPRLTATNRFYWEAGRDGVLKLLRCEDCSAWIHPPRPLCPICLGENVGPKPLSGKGSIYSVSVNHQAWVPGLEVPYVIARVAPDETPEVLLTTNIIGDGALDTAVGDRVTVSFEEQEGLWFPLFRREMKGRSNGR